MITRKINKIRKINKKKSKKIKGELFSNDNPETTVHGYGFANSRIAIRTIDDLKNRDIDYQFQVVNTMYNRGLVIIKKMKDINKIKLIKQALDIYKKWIIKYKSENLLKKLSKPYLTPRQISDLEFLAEYYNISRKARGLEKPTTSDIGFLVIWRKVNGDKKQLRIIPVKEKVPYGQTWDKQRNNFINRRLSMIKNSKDNLYYTSGHYKGLPTKLHINMIMWAYSPDASKVLSSIKEYKQIISNNIKKKFI